MKDYSKHMVPAAVIIGLVAVWEAAVRIKDIPFYVLPAPTDVVRAVFAEAPNLARHGAVTVLEALAGMAIAFLLALVLGILMDMFPLMKRAVYPLLVATQTVPMIVLAPILIIYLGFGMTPKILTVVLMCFFPIAVSFTDGMAQLNPQYVNLVRSYGAKGFAIYRLVKIPAAIPSLLSGMKVAATYSISGAVVGAVSYTHLDNVQGCDEIPGTGVSGGASDGVYLSARPGDRAAPLCLSVYGFQRDQEKDPVFQRRGI